MALITEVTLLQDSLIFDEIEFKTFFNLETFDPILMCIYLTKDTKEKWHIINLNIPSDIYDNWGVDNQIVVDWAIQNLGHTLA
jgi:hypothetical protein